MPFDAGKFRKDIERAHKKAGSDFFTTLKKPDLDEIGKAVTDEMKVLIAKGISPIKSNGRFAAYKWAGIKNEFAKAARAARKGIKSRADDVRGLARELRTHRLLIRSASFSIKQRSKSKSGRKANAPDRASLKAQRAKVKTLASSVKSGRTSVSAARATLKKASAELARQIPTRYPFNKMKEFPSKKLRPVNLKLSGDFLRDLTYRSQVAPPIKGASPTIDIGFFGGLSEKKESGHREGVNGQPKRPTIPQKKEEFSPSIYRRLVKTITGLVKRKIASSKK